MGFLRMSSDSKELNVDKLVASCGCWFCTLVAGGVERVAQTRAAYSGVTGEPLTYLTLDGGSAVNMSVLKSVVAAEGYAFEHVSGGVSAEEMRGMAQKDKDTVFYQCASDCDIVQRMIESDPTYENTFLGFLCNGHCHYGFAVSDGIKKCAVIKWLTANNECVVCYEKLDTQFAKMQLIPCEKCYTTMCYGCFVDMFSAAKSHGFKCPICRKSESRWDFFVITLSILNQGRKKLDGMTDSQLDFIASLLEIDLRRDWLTDEECLKLVTLIRHKWHCCDETESFSKAQAFMRNRRKSSMAITRAAGGSAVERHTRNGCANCGKSFWNKPEWKRAPKCTKCKRVAYCSAKCRKRHWKRHATRCKALATKRKRKTKKK